MKSSYDMFLRRGMAMDKRQTAPARPRIDPPTARQVARSSHPRAFILLSRLAQDKEDSRLYQDAIHYRDSPYQDTSPHWQRRAVPVTSEPIPDPSANIQANTRIRLAKAKSSLKKTLQYRRGQ